MSADRETLAKALIERGVQHMNPHLRHQYDAIRRLLAHATSADLRARYQVGQIVAGIKRDEARYGARAVTHLAEALARSEATLYRYASVAETWSEEEVSAILERRTHGGEPLSWCHLVKLTQASAERREHLLEEATARGLSVRDLHELVCGRSSDTPLAVPLPLARLKRLVSTCEALEVLLVDDRLVDGVLSATTPGTAELVGSALTAHLRMIRRLEKSVAHLKKAEAKLRRRTCDDSAPSTSSSHRSPRLTVGASS